MVTVVVGRGAGDPRCPHPDESWVHAHYELDGRKYCRIDCWCGGIVEEATEVGDVIDPDWGIPYEVACFGTGESWGSKRWG